MKYLLIFLLFPILSYSQEDTSKYQKYTAGYGPQYIDIWARRVMRIPDTTGHRPMYGAPGAIGRNTAGTAAFIWNGLDWKGLGGVDSIYYGHDTLYLATSTGIITAVPNSCPPTFGEIEGDALESVSLAEHFAGKEDALGTSNSTTYLRGDKGFSDFDSSVLAGLGMTVATISGLPFYTWNSNSNFLIARGNIGNLDTTGIPGGTYYYNISTTGTKPGTTQTGTVYIYFENDVNFNKPADKGKAFAIDANGQMWTRKFSAGVWDSTWLSPLYDGSVYLANTGNPQLNGYLTYVNKSAAPSNPASGQSTFYFDAASSPRWVASNGHYVRITSSYATDITLPAENIATSGTAPISITSNVVSITQAATGTNGYLSSTDWNTFNGKQSPLVPITVQAANYTASAYDFVPCNNAGGSFTVTLPNAPADKAMVGVIIVTQSGSNTITIACAGSDVFNKTGGGTSTSLSLVNQTVILQYRASLGVWYILSTDVPLTGLDARYLTPSTAASTYQPLDADLTTIAGLTATTDNFMVGVSSAWASRTPAQVRTTLGLVIGTDVQAYNANAALKPVSVVLGSPVTTTSSTMGNATGVSVAVSAGVIYKLEILIKTACGGAGGVKLGLNISGSPTFNFGDIYGQLSSATSTKLVEITAIDGSSMGNFNTVAANGLAKLTCEFTAGSSGTAQLTFASVTATQTSTIRAGTTIILTQLQ